MNAPSPTLSPPRNAPQVRRLEPSKWRDWLRRGEEFLQKPQALALAFILFLILFALHRLDGLLHPQLWAEDGTVFFHDADQFGIGSLFIPRVGYFHTLPRLIALVAHQFDPSWTPALYNYLALLVSALTALCLVSPRMPGGRLGGLAMALLLLITPNYSGEVFLTPTNLQWITAPLMAALLLKSPAPMTTRAVLDGLLLFLIGVTCPFSIVLAPLACLWVLLFRQPLSASDSEQAGVRGAFPQTLAAQAGPDRSKLIPVAFLILAAVIQASAVLTSPHLQLDDKHPRPMTLELLVQAIGFRTAAETFVPQLPAGDVLVRLFMGVLTFAGLGALGLLPGKYRPARLLLVGIILAYLATTVVRCWGMGSTLLDDGLGDRYFYPIRIHLLWCCLLAGLDAWSARHWLGIWCGFLLGLAVVASIRVYCVSAWADEHWEKYVPAIRDGRPVDIPLNPLWIYHYPGHK